VAAACGGEAKIEGRAVARVAGLDLDERVVEHIAQTEGIDREAARARGVNTLRLVAASRDAAASAAGEPQPELEPAREAQLRRAAKARLLLATEFEPSHGPDDIPDGDPLLARARETPAWVHPEVVRVCQLLVMPKGVEGDAAREMAEDPKWRAHAMAIAERLHHRVERHVPPGDEAACRLLARQLEMSRQPADERFQMKFEPEIGYDLDACAETADDGTCITPSLVPEWTSVIAAVSPPALVEPFATRFGVHVVLATAIEPDRPAGAPATEAFLRAQVHPRWQTEAFSRYLDALAAEHTVRVASEPPS
jgi:hypothetical protein